MSNGFQFERYAITEPDAICNVWLVITGLVFKGYQNIVCCSDATQIKAANRKVRLIKWLFTICLKDT